MRPSLFHPGSTRVFNYRIELQIHLSLRKCIQPDQWLRLIISEFMFSLNAETKYCRKKTFLPTKSPVIIEEYRYFFQRYNIWQHHFATKCRSKKFVSVISPAIWEKFKNCVKYSYFLFFFIFVNSYFRFSWKWERDTDRIIIFINKFCRYTGISYSLSGLKKI